MEPTASVLLLLLLGTVIGVLGLSLWLARPGQPHRVYFMACAALILLGLVAFVALGLRGGYVDADNVVRDPPLFLGLLPIYLGVMGVVIRLLVSAMVRLFLRLRARRLPRV